MQVLTFVVNEDEYRNKVLMDSVKVIITLNLCASNINILKKDNK